MTTLVFQCPRCRVYSLKRVMHADFEFGFANLLPVPLQCWNCGIDCLVVQRDRVLSPSGSWDTLAGHCARIASSCRERSANTQSSVQKMSFNNLEHTWLKLGQMADADHMAVLLGATARQRPSAPIKLRA